MKRACEYIQLEDGRIFVPRPTSVFGGMARRVWLQERFGNDAVIEIASPDYWERLVDKHEVKIVSD